MDLILELAWLLLELVIELFFGAAELGVLDDLGLPNRRFWDWVGCAAAGLTLGAASSWLLPSRLLPMPATRGISLLLSPVLSGLAMSLWGSYRRGQGRSAGGLATFWGGASFAFGCAVGRFVSIG